jgi:hypothetical protein
MRSTEWLSASRSVLELVPRPARIAPRAAIGDRGRWAGKRKTHMKKLSQKSVVIPQGF